MIVLSVVDHFGRHILKSATEGLALAFVLLAINILFKIAFTCPAKVANFEHVVFADQQIFWL